MRAITYTQFGPASEVLTLDNLPEQSPGPGEVLVRLAYSGANPSDVKARAGGRPGVTSPPFPKIIPHSDGSGEIVEVGPGLARDLVGRKVWIWNGQWQRAFGTACELICLPADQAVVLPNGIYLATGATLGIPALTAAHCVYGGHDVRGTTVLISGGAGAVGHNAVQLAKWAGARVIATASPSAFDRVSEAGADHVLDYRDPDLAEQIKALAPAGIDRAIEVEFGVNAALLADVMRANGTIAAYGSALDMAPVLPFGPFLFKAVTIDIVLVYLLSPQARGVAIERLHDALSKGGLRPAIHKTFALDDCAAAHDCIAAGGRSGAVLLEI